MASRSGEHTLNCRACCGPPAPPSRLAIVQAIRPGSKRARSQRAYLRAVVSDPVIAELRADRRRAVLELARILARHADWRTMTSWRPRERACAEIGSSRDPSKPLSISAYSGPACVLEERGFLGLVAQGWTSALRAGALDDGTGTSAVFVLTIPGRKQRIRSDGESPRVNGPLTGFRRKPGIALPRARPEPRSRAETRRSRARRPALRADSPCCRPLLSSPSALSLRTAARRWGRLRPCRSAPVCSGGCPLSISAPGAAVLRGRVVAP